MDTTTPPATAPAESLRHELSLTDAAAFSVGLIGPVGAIGLLGTGAALIIGSGCYTATRVYQTRASEGVMRPI